MSRGKRSDVDRNVDIGNHCRKKQFNRAGPLQVSISTMSSTLVTSKGGFNSRSVPRFPTFWDYQSIVKLSITYAVQILGAIQHLESSFDSQVQRLQLQVYASRPWPTNLNTRFCWSIQQSWLWTHFPSGSNYYADV